MTWEKLRIEPDHNANTKDWYRVYDPATKTEYPVNVRRPSCACKGDTFKEGGVEQTDCRHIRETLFRLGKLPRIIEEE